MGVEHVLEAYLAGSLPEEIALDFPTVTLFVSIQACQFRFGSFRAPSPHTNSRSPSSDTFALPYCAGDHPSLSSA